MKPRYWLVSYDISDAKRRHRVAKLALENGERVQKSLYLCTLSPEQLDQLQRQLTEYIDATDRLMLRPVCRHCLAKTRHQGLGDHPERREAFWII